MAAVDIFNAASATTTTTTSDMITFGQNSPDQSLTTTENNNTAKLFEALDASDDSSMKGSLEEDNSSVDDTIQNCKLCK